MTIAERLLVIIDADTKGAIRSVGALGTAAEKSLDSSNSKLEKFSTGAIRFGAAASAGAGLAAVGLYKAAQQASDLGESINKNNVVFGRNGAEVVKWSGKLADSFGLSQREALNASGAFGSMFRTTGLAEKASAKMSRRLVELAADMASFNNEDPSEMLDRLRAGLSGEAEPLRRFGVLLSEARVKTFAYNNGIAQSGKELTEAQKVQARYGVILKDTTLQQGDFARTADGTANAQRRLSAQFDNLTTSIGKAALPVLQKTVGALNDAATAFNGLDGSTGGALGQVALIGTAATAAVGGIALLTGAITKMKLAMTDSALLSGRFGGALKGLAGLAGTAGLIYTVASALNEWSNKGKTSAEVVAAASKKTTAQLTRDFIQQQKTVTAATRSGLIDQGRFREIAEGNLGTAKRLLDGLRDNADGAKKAGVAIAPLAKIYDEVARGQRQVAKDTDVASKATDESARAAGGAARADAQYAAAQDKLIEKIKKGNEVLDERRIAMLSAFNSEVGAAQAVQSLAETLKDSEDPLEKQAALLSAAAAEAQKTTDNYNSLGIGTATQEQQTQFFRDALIKLKEQFPELSGLVDDYVARLGSVPPNVDTNVKANVDPGALDAFIDKLRTVNLLKAILEGRAGPHPGQAKPPGQAATGGVHTGWTIVGEKGPELVHLGSPSRVLTASESAARLRSADRSNGGSRAPIVVNVNALVADANTGRRVKEALEAYERNSGSRWRT